MPHTINITGSDIDRNFEYVFHGLSLNLSCRIRIGIANKQVDLFSEICVFTQHRVERSGRLFPEFQNQLPAHVQIFVLHIRIIAKHFQRNGAVITGCL